MDYVCCSSYERPRSKAYHYEHYVKLIEAAGVPYITFHDLRHIYTDMKMMIEDCVEEMQEFISEIHPYDATDKYMLEEMFQEKTVLDESEKVGWLHSSYPFSNGKKAVKMHRKHHFTVVFIADI